MAIINVLDKHTAELIAAGEVVERPAAALKELLENAIDAGSTKVRVVIERGGVGLIEVADDGTGIEAQYVKTAFVRHATSKIKTKDDLGAIATLGFRGEALASIAAVSKVTLTTKTDSAEHALQFEMQGGEEGELLPAARGQGTTICVRELFYNTPARMKFLKKDSSEGLLCQDVALRLALSHPEVAITFEREGKTVFATPGDGDLLTAVHAVFGAAFAKTLIPVEGERGYVTVKGYVSAPGSARGSRSMQHFFVNNRYVKNRTMQAALEGAFKGYIMGGKFPACVLKIDMPFELVDVNVHPAKTEIRFADEREIFSAVYGAVKTFVSLPDAALNDFQLPVSQTDETARQETPVNVNAFTDVSHVEKNYPNLILDDLLKGGTSKPADGNAEFAAHSMPFAYASESVSPVQNHHYPSSDITVADEPLNTYQSAFQSDPPYSSEEKSASGEELLYVGELFETYVIAAQGETVCFIDKHAAHERILYEKLLAGLGAREGQVLMQAQTVLLSGEEKTALLQNITLLENAGFMVEDFGANTVLVREVPQDLILSAVGEAIQEIAGKFVTGKTDAVTQHQQWVYASVSCRAAIKAGDKNSSEEMLQLAKQILSGSVPLFCPHGRPILLKLTQKELEKNFGRIVQ